MENFKFLVKKGGEVRTGFNSMDEAQAYARKVNGTVVESTSSNDETIFGKLKTKIKNLF